MINVNEQYCPQNHPCPVVSACPFEAITQKDIFSAPEVDEELCTECGECTSLCPVFSFHRVPVNQ